MMQWERGTKWRQGAMILIKDCNLFSNLSNDVIALAISHDCDIANDDLTAEPYVEFVLCQVIAKKDGNYEFAKNPRILHLPMYLNKELCTIEMIAHQKHAVLKEHLVKFTPNANYELRDLNTLRSWLAARYRRQTLPDSLADIMKPVFGFLSDRCKKFASGIITFYLDYEPKTNPEDKDPYEFWIYVVYICDDEEIAKEAKKIAAEVEEKFLSIISSTNAVAVILHECVAYSAIEYTLHDVRRHIEYKIEHLSNRLPVPGPVVE